MRIVTRKERARIVKNNGVSTLEILSNGDGEIIAEEAREMGEDENIQAFIKKLAQEIQEENLKASKIYLFSQKIGVEFYILNKYLEP